MTASSDLAERQRAIAAEHGSFFADSIPSEGILKFVSKLVRGLDRILYGRVNLSEEEADIIAAHLTKLFDLERDLKKAGLK